MDRPPFPTPRPPALARALLRWTTPPRYRDAALGDLDEEFATVQAPAHGLGSARRWYWAQVLGSLAPNLALRVSRSGRRASHRQGTRQAAPGDGLVQDLRFTARIARADTAYALTVVLTLALGIGASTVIYGVVDGVILHPFPFPEPDRLVAIGVENPERGIPLDFIENVSPPEFLDIRSRSRTLEHFYAFDDGPDQISSGDGALPVWRMLGWGDAFRTLGVEPYLGRGFLPHEMEPYGAPVAVLSHRLWVESFGADSSLLGRTVRVDREPRTVVGIMPPGVRLRDADLWTPAGSPPARRARGPRRQFQVLARIRPGHTLGDVNRELEAFSRQVAAEHLRRHPEYAGWRLRAATWTAVNVGELRPVLTFLFGAVILVLLLVCVNVSTLGLARATSRAREMAVRTAMGASRRRLVQLLLTETMAMALVGALLGMGLALGGLAAARNLAAVLPDVHGTVEPNPRVLLFTLGVTVAAGLLAGLLPALRASGTEIHGVLRSEGSTSSAGRRRLRALRASVAAQAALCLVLLVAAGLAARGFMGVLRIDPGFDTSRLLTFRIDLPGSTYGPEETVAFYGELERRVGELPGVTGAAVAMRLPGLLLSPRRIRLEGQQGVQDDALPRAYVNYASPGILDVLGIPVVRGRPLADEDGGPGAVPAAVVNESFARRFFPDGRVLGRRFRDTHEDEAPWFEIVGVAADVRNASLTEPAGPEAWVFHGQAGGSKSKLYAVARTRDDPRSIVPGVRRVVADLDPEQPVLDVQPLAEVLGRELVPLKVSAATTAFFALVALVLTAVGVAGVVAFLVEARTREIGVRRVLGAGAWEVRRRVVAGALWPVAAGALVGLVVAAVAVRVLSSPMLPTGSLELVLAAAPLLLVGVALGAACLPAVRAGRLDPVETLRSE